MNLSEVKTMDGVGLVEGQTCYIVGRDTGTFYIINVQDAHARGGSIVVFIRGQSIRIPIVSGIAIGLWHSREVLEAGLGKWAQ